MSRFAEHISHVIYDADQSCVADIAARWTNTSTVLPHCLAAERRESTFYVNYCPFTSSVFAFNDQFNDYYEEKRLGYSDYVFKKSFEPQKELVLVTETIDGLFADKKIPQVDFLSIDTQGSELLILEGGTKMLTTTTIGVSCEVNFVDLYRGVPLFGDVDSFMRQKGFLLAGLAPMTFGYKRIPREFRGVGIPVQGEALYLRKPENVQNEDLGERQRRLEKLAFCALAFGFTELAHEAVGLSWSINVLESHEIQQFLRMFYHEIAKDPTLPPLWHDCVEAKVSAEGAGDAAQTAPRGFRLINRLRGEPNLFANDCLRFVNNYIIKTLVFLNLQKLGFNAFESFLSRHGFEQAAKEVFFRRLR